MELDTPLGTLALGNNSNAQPAIRTLQNQLLVPPRADEIAHALDQDEPAHNHQSVGEPIAARDAGASASGLCGIGALGDFIRVEVVTVGVVGDACVEVLTGVAVSTPRVEGSGAEAEAELDEGDAEAGAGAVFGGVGRVQEVGEQEADELEGHADHGVPDEAEEGADGEALDEDFVAKGAGGQDGGFPVGRGCVGGGLFVRLRCISKKGWRCVTDCGVPVASPRDPPPAWALRSGSPRRRRCRRRRRARWLASGC